MKKITLLLSALLVLSLGAFAQDRAKEDEILASDPYIAYGYNDVINPSTFQTPTKAPKGYEPVYIAHYGRHGSRYAWNSKTYTWILEVLTDSKEKGNLTEFGEILYDAYKPFAEFCVQHTGELTRKGWAQHNAISKHMFKSYPKLFSKNPKIEAASSNSPRAMMSMSAFCVGLKECNPKLDIYAQMTPTLFVDCIPESAPNGIGKQDRLEKKNAHGLRDYLSSLADIDGILGRIFKDPAAASFGDKYSFSCELYTAYIGLRSLDFEVEFPELFSDEEYLAFYKYDCANMYRESAGALDFAAIIKRLIESADEALQSDRPSVKLRFGHDYVLNQYLSLLGVETFGQEIPSLEEAYVYYPVRKIPMGANIQFIFFKSKKSDEVLVKAVLDGREAKLPVEPVEGPFYKWSDYKDYLTRTVLFSLK